MLAGAQDRAALLNADQRFFGALQRQDLRALEALLADDFVIVAINDGSVADRSTLLTAMREGQLQFPSIDSFPEEAVVRRIDDVGIVVGRTSMTFRGVDGEPFQAASRYTHTWHHDGGSWRLLSAQGAAIPN